MGVPGLYRTLFQRYGSTYRWVVPGNDTVVDYLYLDFNPIVYICFNSLCKSGHVTAETTLAETEKMLILEVIKETSNIINILVKPTKMTYIAIDGPVPKCKLLLQRNRRYKGMYEDNVIAKIQAKYSNAQASPKWSTSNITPGSPFMNNLNIALWSAINQGIFSRHPHENGYTVIFSDSNFPGEGEHKITNDIEKRNCLLHETVCIYSNDGDMIMLGCRFPNQHILIITNPSSLPKSVIGEHDLKNEYIYFDHTEFRKALFNDLGEEFMEGRDQGRVLKDIMAICFLAGNDFVQPITFMKMRYSYTFSTLLEMYVRVQSHRDDYFVTIGKTSYNLNHNILVDIMLELAKQENFRMREYQNNIVNSLKQPPEPWGPFENWEEEWSQYQHTYYFNPSHPESDQCKDDFLHFGYSDSGHKHEWKMQYYSYFFNLDNDIDDREYNKFRTSVCVKYLKSLIFTLRYYLNSRPPSWRWNYPYNVAPWPSDILIVLNKIRDIRNISDFMSNGVHDIYTPLEQLLLTVPKQKTSGMFPKEYQSVIRMLPTVDSIQLEYVSGEKYIYSEPRLPTFNENMILKETKKIKLTGEAELRNRLNFRLYTKTFQEPSL
jgi:5'-3' exonuclease